jgi:hypothetical protein
VAASDERAKSRRVPFDRRLERSTTSSNAPAAAPIRVDVVDANGQPVATSATEERETPGASYDIGRHMTQEPHGS